LTKTSTTILVAPLNWGLGHATRCIPIIKALAAQNCRIILACDGRALSLLQKEFPQLESIQLKSYEIRYQKKGNFVRTVLSQVPKILKSIRQEHQALQQLVEEYQIDIVLSDNRYGLWSPKTYNIFMSHQLFIRMPKGLRFLEPLVFKVNHRYIDKFDECWIPDFTNEFSLAGDLSNREALDPNRYHFIGPLSRMQLKEVPLVWDLIIVLSGPEPQRSIFEEKLIQQAQQIKQKILLVRGVTETNNTQVINEWLTIKDYLTSADLNKAILSAKLVLARSGYSTIMDLYRLKKPAILVPTPGQTEQEYLGSYLMQKKHFFCAYQEPFKLSEVLKNVESFNFAIEAREKADNHLNKAIQRILQKI